MKYLIFGAGALGSVFGGFLHKAGKKVSLLGRPWHLKKIEREALMIEGLWGTHRIKGLNLHTGMNTLPRDFDVVLLCVKAYATEEAVAEILAHLNKPYVVSLQNGLGNWERIAEGIGPDRTIGGRVIFGAEIIEPAQVKVTVSADDTLLGRISEETPPDLVEEIASDIREAGIPTRVVEGIETHLWGKVFYNCALNPLGALLGVSYGELASNESSRSIMERIIRECYRVARARGVALPWRSEGEYFDHFLRVLIPPTSNHKPSMLIDLRRESKTEIDSLNGAISLYGEQLGIATPYNRMVTEMIKFHEKTM